MLRGNKRQRKTLTQDDRQVFIVGDVLHLCDEDATSFLEQPLVVPEGIDVRKPLGQMIVVADEYGVEGRQCDQHVGSTVTC